jgi:nucleoside-diphosphate-sugar epimerase
MLTHTRRNPQPAPLRAKRAGRLATENERRDAKLGGSRARRVLLVGGSGYIGGPVTAHLLGLGYEVTNLDLLVYRHGSVSLGFIAHPGYRFVIGDMGDTAALDRALDRVTDVVILAGLVGDPITRKFPQESADINDAALRCCIDHLNGRNLESVVFISTCSNYGLVEGDALVDENAPLSPLSLYAKSKVAAETYLLSLQGQIDYQPTILRFATAFGLAPRMRFDLTVNEFARELYLGRELVVYDAENWRPYCHVRDFARLIARVLESADEDVAFEVFNAGGEQNNHTKQELVEIILARLPQRTVSYRSNSADRRSYRVDFSKVRRRLDFEPLYSVADGVEEIIWAIGAGLLDEVDLLPQFYGNYALPGLRGASAEENGTRAPTERRA